MNALKSSGGAKCVEHIWILHMKNLYTHSAIEMIWLVNALYTASYILYFCLHNFITACIIEYPYQKSSERNCWQKIAINWTKTEFNIYPMASRSWFIIVKIVCRTTNQSKFYHFGIELPLREKKNFFLLMLLFLLLYAASQYYFVNQCTKKLCILPKNGERAITIIQKYIYTISTNTLVCDAMKERNIHGYTNTYLCACVRYFVGIW